MSGWSIKNNLLIARKPDGKRSQCQLQPSGIEATIAALELKTNMTCPNRQALIDAAPVPMPDVAIAPPPPPPASEIDVPETESETQLRELVAAQQQIIACLQKDNARLAIISGQKDDIIHSIHKTLAELHNMTSEIHTKLIA